MDKILSVVIPSYNTEKYIEECTVTLLDDRIIDDIEVLIVDDGSTDNTAKLAKKIEERYPNTVRHIYKENGGHGSTINKGIVEAKGKYFRVIDGDDWVDTEQFVKYVNKLKESDSDIILTSFNRVFDGSSKVEKVSTDMKEGKYKIEDIIYTLGDNYQIHSTTFRTEIIKKIRAITEHCFYVDQEYIIYPLVYSNTITNFNITVYQYRIGTSEQSMSEKNMIKNRNMHKKVIYELIKFERSNEMNEEISRFIRTKISKMSSKQIRIYLAMDNVGDAGKECNTFLQTLKKEAPYIYKKMPGKKAWLLRFSKGQMFNLLWKISN